MLYLLLLMVIIAIPIAAIKVACEQAKAQKAISVKRRETVGNWVVFEVTYPTRKGTVTKLERVKITHAKYDILKKKEV